MLKNSKVVLFLSKLVRPETFGPYYVYTLQYDARFIQG